MLFRFCAATICSGHPFAIVTPLYSTSSSAQGSRRLQEIHTWSCTSITGCRIMGFPHRAHWTRPAWHGRQKPPVNSATQSWIVAPQDTHSVVVMIYLANGRVDHRRVDELTIGKAAAKATAVQRLISDVFSTRQYGLKYIRSIIEPATKYCRRPRPRPRPRPRRRARARARARARSLAAPMRGGFERWLVWPECDRRTRRFR